MTTKRISVALSDFANRAPSDRLKACLLALQSLTSDLRVSQDYMTTLRRHLETALKEGLPQGPRLPISTSLQLARFHYENCLFREQAILHRIAELEAALSELTTNESRLLTPSDSALDMANLVPAISRLREAIAANAHTATAGNVEGYFRVAYIEEPPPPEADTGWPSETDLAAALVAFLQGQENSIQGVVTSANSLVLAAPRLP